MNHPRRISTGSIFAALLPLWLVAAAGMWMISLRAEPTSSYFSTIQETGLVITTGDWQIRAGETLRLEGDAAGFWETSLVVLPPPQPPEMFNQHIGVTGRLCLTNLGTEPVAAVWLAGQVEVAEPGGSYYAVAGAAFQHQLESQLDPGGSRCFLYRQEFDPFPGAVYRLSVNAGLPPDHQRASVFLGQDTTGTSNEVRLSLPYSLPDQPAVLTAMTATPAPTGTETPTPSPSETPTSAPTATESVTPSPTLTLLPSMEPTATPASTLQPGATEEYLPQPSATSLPTVTSAPSETPLPIASPTPLDLLITDTPLPVETPTQPPAEPTSTAAPPLTPSETAVLPTSPG